MNKIIMLLASVMLFATACDNKQSEAQKENNVVEKQLEQNVDAKSISVNHNAPIWEQIAGRPEVFNQEFAKLDDAEKYYFCSAFTIVAMSVSKPGTASAMRDYFLGLGVAKYNRGIDEATYKAFDFGKNIILSELVVEDILANKTCENIVVEASDFAKDKNYTTEQLNDMGKVEVEKIIKYINKN